MNKKLAVEIAKDVLAQLKVKKFIATSGDYCSLYEKNDELGYCYGTYIDVKTSAKELFRNNKKVFCRVCALGSLFMSYVNLKNKKTVEEINRFHPHNGPNDENTKILLNIFHPADLIMMETVFEIGEVSQDLSGDRDTVSKDIIQMCEDYGCGFDDEDSRLKAIMKNIIRNNGRFILPRRIVRYFKKNYDPDTYANANSIRM